MVPYLLLFITIKVPIKIITTILSRKPSHLPKSLCLVIIALISVVQSERAADLKGPPQHTPVPPIPKGIFSMPAAEAQGFPDQILNDPRIVGLDLGGGWADFERTEGVYDWSDVDSELAKAEAHGKKVLLRIVTGGINVPDWLLANPNVQTFSFIDTNPNHDTYGEELTIPVFWDPIFLAKKIAFTQAAGAHFAAHTSIAVVACSFANATTGDWNMPDAPEDIANWRAAGYSTELMVNAGQIIIDATMAAFPNQNVVLSIGGGLADLDPTSNYLAETAVNYATTTYGRFITEKNSLSATTVDPAGDNSSLWNWQILFDQCPNVAAQMLWFVSGDHSYQMNGGTPGNEQDILLNAVTVGTHYGTQYQEIYEKDLKDPAMSSVIDAASTLIRATPPPPPAPSNLNGTSDSPWSENLTWHDNANNELGYGIEFKIGATGTYELVTTLGPNTTSTTITSLLEGTQYYYRTQGVNAGGVSAYSNEKAVTTLLTSPAALTAQAFSSSQVILNWTDRSATETGFRIERSPVTNTHYTEIATVAANSTSFTDSGLSESTAYWYRVRGYNTDATSAYSNEKKATTLHNIPAPPSGLRITSLLSNTVGLAWSDNSGNELHFKIQRKQGATGTYAEIATTPANITSRSDFWR